MLDNAESKLYDVTQGNIKKSSETAQSLVIQAKNKIESISNKKGLSGIPSGFNKIDKLTAGWQQSDLVIIAARPGMGKTALALSMASNIAIENNHSLLIRILGYVNPFYIFNRKIPPGLRIKNFLESLGPMFIKFGQLLSTRTDVVPVKITSHLKELTDQCKPFATNDAKKIIERSLNIKIDEVFKDFEDTPLAAASLAQVHKAKIKKTNEKVVIKVLRPGIHKRVKRNVRVMTVSYTHLTLPTKRIV